MRQALLIIAIAALATAAGAQDATTNVSIAAAVGNVVEVLQKYGLPFSATDARDAAIDALVQTADPAARVLSAEDQAALNDQRKGVLYDAGIRVTITNGVPTIGEIRAGSPAEGAGLKTGDILEEIDKGNVGSLKLWEINELLRGAKDASVTLKVHSVAGGTNMEPREVDVKRSATQVPAIETAEEMPDRLCYLRVNGLYERSGKDLVTTLRGWASTGKAGVVIDLRGAGGGDLDSAADVASLFTDSGSVLFSFRDRNDQDLSVHKGNAATQLELPTMVLVDGETVDAAEVLASALAGSARGIMLIGTTTGADPLVRDVVPLADGSQLYLVTKRLVTADGKKYDGSDGVAPDLTVNASEESDTEYEPELVSSGKKVASDQEKEDRKLRDRVRGDAALRRATDILLGLKALNIRGNGKPENTEP